ncbi:YodC family protein [Pantoea agglomerans]|uniref:YodC family protein n=1 Tax=Enterobacter agglomerans TaxID=549 RepID=UPI003159FC78
MAVKFENGTVVQLKSGGPSMTVDSYNESEQKYLCEWFQEGKIQRELFREASLDKFESAFGIY